jgi:hypothetical protein
LKARISDPIEISVLCSVCAQLTKSKFDEPEIVIRKIPRFTAEQKGFSHRHNFAGWILIGQQVVLLAQQGRILP